MSQSPTPADPSAEVPKTRIPEVRKPSHPEGFASEFLLFLRERKLLWLTPILLLLGLLGGLLIFAQSSPLAPFIYAIF